MSLREQLAAKTRRTVVVPVLVSDPGEDVRRLEEARAGYLAAAVRGRDVEDAKASLDAAAEAVQAHYADAVFQALDPDDFEAVAAAYPSTDGQDGGLDWKAALPVLAAACAVDETVRDKDWWATQLDSGVWSHGEKLALWSALLHINYATLDPRVPKG